MVNQFLDISESRLIQSSFSTIPSILKFHIENQTSLTFPKPEKKFLTSSTVVDADKPPTNIFFVLVTI